MRTAVKSTPNPNNSVSRPRNGESRRRRVSPMDNSEETLCLRVCTFGPTIRACAEDAITSINTSVNFVMTTGGQEESGAEKLIRLPSSTDPVTTRRDRAPHTSVLNLLAKFTNPRSAERGSGSFLSRGTTTRERNNIPPTQKVAATRWIQTRIILNRFTSGIVARSPGAHHIKMHTNSERENFERIENATAHCEHSRHFCTLQDLYLGLKF